ncbi:MAG: hypothetical protein HYU64_05055 [Armatimonadetes bacterium]|nr:hypothetical protein [Armatimonadota bacterium]
MEETVGLRERDLVSGLPSSVVFERARASRHVLGRANRALLFWVEEIARRKLFTELGYTSVFAFCEMELSLDPHTISEMLRTSQCLRDLPGLLAASSEIAPSKLREISRVCTPRTENFWIETARTKTCREIEKLVAITPKGGLPTLEHKHSSFPETPGSLNGGELRGREAVSLSSGLPPAPSLLDQEHIRAEAVISETVCHRNRHLKTATLRIAEQRIMFPSSSATNSWPIWRPMPGRFWRRPFGRQENRAAGGIGLIFCVTWRSSSCMRFERKRKREEKEKEKEKLRFLLRPVGW